MCVVEGGAHRRQSTHACTTFTAVGTYFILIASTTIAAIITSGFFADTSLAALPNTQPLCEGCVAARQRLVQVGREDTKRYGTSSGGLQLGSRRTGHLLVEQWAIAHRRTVVEGRSPQLVKGTSPLNGVNTIA